MKSQGQVSNLATGKDSTSSLESSQTHSTVSYISNENYKNNPMAPTNTPTNQSVENEQNTSLDATRIPLPPFYEPLSSRIEESVEILGDETLRSTQPTLRSNLFVQPKYRNIPDIIQHKLAKKKSIPKSTVVAILVVVALMVLFLIGTVFMLSYQNTQIKGK